MTSVWLLDAQRLDDGVVLSCLPWLSASELARAGSFLRPRRRRQFVFGRVLLRQALGITLGVPALDVVLDDRPGDAPRLATPSAPACGFSLSHSGGWVACAVSSDTKLGLDIECIDQTRDIAALAEQAFSKDELAALHARPQATRLRDFYTMWSAAEARFKLGVPAAGTVVLDHPSLAIVLCSAAALDSPPPLVIANLLPDPAPDAR